MPDKQFDEAKLLYDLLTKGGQPTNIDLRQLIPLLGLSTNANDLLARLDRLKKGLPAEDEFMALAVWMEKCNLIHKLEQEQFPVSSTDKYQVPDLLAVFNYEGKEIPVLIEVKSSEKEILPNGKFRLSARAYKKLTNYANLVGLPLLIAWKVSGYWTLFDIREMRIHNSAYHIDGQGAMQADLMYLLLDNINIIPMPGVSFTFSFEDLNLINIDLKNKEVRKARLSKIHFTDIGGEPITKMTWAQFVLWMFVEHEETQGRRNNFFDISFSVPSEPSPLPSFALLPLMLFQMTKEEERPQNWHDVIKNKNYGAVSYSKFKKAAEDGMGTFIQYILQVIPHKYPDFLPPRDFEENYW